MSQCVPSWDLDDSHHSLPVPELTHGNHHTNSSSLSPDVHHSLNYEVAELTWVNGQLGMHGLGTPRLPTKYTLDKPRAGGTLESIVSQATRVPNHRKSAVDGGGDGGDELVPWFDNHRADTPKKVMSTASVAMTIDALVPCGNTTRNNSDQHHHRRREHSDGGVRVPGCSTPVGSCSGAANGGWADRSVSVSATCGGDSLQVTADTSSDRELGAGRFTSTSMGSPENTSFDDQCTDRTGDGHDSVCRGKSKKEAGDEEDNKKGSKVSTKRSRAAAIHNQSERKRRDKISQRMKTLQKLVPNSNKTDKASMLDEVIDYLKQLQAQVQMMGRMNNNMSPMMSPLAMQQHLQMSMMHMTPMGMGMGMGLGMGMGMGMAGVVDINTLGRHNIPGMPPVLHPAAAAAFMPVTSWDGTTDPYAALLACQSQPMTMDAYSRMAALYQQFQQPHAGSAGLKN